MIEVKKPLVAAGKIANKGNIIVLGEDGGESYIYKKNKKSIPMYQENNVYVVNVDFMTDLSSMSLTQQRLEVLLQRPVCDHGRELPAAREHERIETMGPATICEHMQQT